MGISICLAPYLLFLLGRRYVEGFGPLWGVPVVVGDLLPDPLPEEHLFDAVAWLLIHHHTRYTTVPWTRRRLLFKTNQFSYL